MPYNGISTSLLSYMQSHPNRVVTIEDLEREFKGRFDHSQLMSNMANLLKTNAGSTIERLQTGMWKFIAAVDKTPDATVVFELLRELPDSLLLIDDAGELYRAKRINVD